MQKIPHLKTGNAQADKAFRIALGDLLGNIVPFKDGLLKKEEEVIIAGMDYCTPWTRDAAINIWNGAGLLFPEAAKNTLLSVLEGAQGEAKASGEYWDAVIWTIGAWWQYVYTGDREFLKLAFEAIKNTLRYFERTEFSPQLGLFRGGACYGDGVSAYGDEYAKTKDSRSGIIDWLGQNPGLAAKPGVGLPMHALSTNALYYQAYRLAQRIAQELHLAGDPSWPEKAENIRRAIDAHLWNEKEGRYDYYLDNFGRCGYQEGIGLAFVLLFGIADEGRARRIFKSTYIAPAGIPCVWPTFPRYLTQDGMGYGRHSGTVWPHIQGFWADAAAKYGQAGIFKHELDALAKHAVRDSQFAEVYHPVTGAIYGGRQEDGARGIGEWKSSARQTWSATAFLRMVFMGMIGMDFTPEGIRFAPLMPEGYNSLELSGLCYRDLVLNISIKGTGTGMEEFRINGELRRAPCLSAQGRGEVDVSILMHG